jgi:hypothetical protein
MIRIKSILVILMIFWITGCHQKKGMHLIKEKGFLVSTEPEYWMFYPTSRLDTNSCYFDFVTENLKTGITIPYDAITDTTHSFLKRSMDTLNLTQDVESSNGKISYLLISAAELEYQIDEKFVGKDSQLKSGFSVQTKDRKIKFVYNQFPITISSVSPIFCFGKTKSNILAIECQHSDQDANDYLYKICEYIRSIDRYSELPHKYKIKAVSTDTLDKKNVVKVELSCCGLGDIAYFDIKTKKIIKLKYGAR